MSLTALRDAIISSIASNITSFKTCQAHGGRFSREELQRIAVHSPAALVTFLGGPLSREGSQAVGDIQIAVFIVTSGTSSVLRDKSALILSEAVCGLVCENKWKYAHAKAPEGMRVDNLYSGDLDKCGVALWSVSWTQAADLAIYDGSALDDLYTVNVKMDLAPADGVIDAEDNIEPRGAFMSTYGNLHISTAAATAIAVIGTYQKLAGTCELDVASSDVDMPANNRLRYTGASPRPFVVDAVVSIAVSADATVTLALAKNGTVDTESAISMPVTLAGGAEIFSLKNIFDLVQNDYVEVWVKATQLVNVTGNQMKLLLSAR